MKNQKSFLFSLVLLVLCSISCANIFNEVVVPNQCKKCELIDLRTGRVVWSDEGCGGGITYLHRTCKVEAYDRSRNGAVQLCDLQCECETWKKPKEQ